MEAKNTNVSSFWIQEIEDFKPGDERERVEREMILELARREGDRLLLRTCSYAHMTASSVIVNSERTKTLFIWHNIYKSWSWTGGHCDGDGHFEEVARREAREETGIEHLRRLGTGMASLEILPVWEHVKRGAVVGSHLHLNVSYLFEADEKEPLHIAPDENSGVQWIDMNQIEQFCTEKDMIPVYKRLICRANDC